MRYYVRMSKKTKNTPATVLAARAMRSGGPDQIYVMGIS